MFELSLLQDLCGTWALVVSWEVLLFFLVQPFHSCGFNLFSKLTSTYLLIAFKCLQYLQFHWLYTVLVPSLVSVLLTLSSSFRPETHTDHLMVLNQIVDLQPKLACEKNALNI